MYLLNFEDGVEDGQDGHLGDADERVMVGGGPLSAGKPVTGERHLGEKEKENHFFLPFSLSPCGLYYKLILIVNDDFRVVSK